MTETVWIGCNIEGLSKYRWGCFDLVGWNNMLNCRYLETTNSAQDQKKQATYMWKGNKLQTRVVLCWISCCFVMAFCSHLQGSLRFQAFSRSLTVGHLISGWHFHFNSEGNTISLVPVSPYCRSFLRWLQSKKKNDFAAGFLKQLCWTLLCLLEQVKIVNSDFYLFFGWDYHHHHHLS